METEKTKLIALCMTTYNRPEVVSDILMRIYTAISIEIFDLFFFDSSNNNAIEMLFRDYQNEYGNCKYIRIDSSVHSNEKVYKIFQNSDIQSEYEYLWMIPDYWFFSRAALNGIIEVMSMRPDMIVLNSRKYDSLPEGKVKDYNELYEGCAWFLTQYGTMVLNCDSVLKNANWGYYSKKYLCVEHRNFSHLAFYFDYMASKGNDIDVWNHRIDSRDVYSSSLKKKSEYYKDFIDVWGRYWPETMMSLPDFYKNKKKAIRMHADTVGTLCVATLAEMKGKKVFSFIDFVKCIKYWTITSPSPTLEIFLLFVLGEKYRQYVIRTGGIKKQRCNRQNKRKLQSFCKKHNDIYIYGAGKVAKEYSNYLESVGVKIKGNIVSDKVDDGMSQVISIESFVDSMSKGIILALGKAAKVEVRQNLVNRSISCDVFDEEIDFEVKKFI